MPGNLGDEVNGSGNGFDVFQQNYSVNAIVVGWTATRADPATHFIRIARRRPGVLAVRGNPRERGGDRPVRVRPGRRLRR